MAHEMRLAEFFAMEAGEYLERLDALVSPREAPDFDELYRLARALRGSALMANQQPIAGAVQAFENLTRVVKEGTRPWDQAVKQMATRAVDDLKILIRKVGSWTDAEDAKAAGLVAELDKMSGRPSAPQRAPAEPGELDTGTRAFIGREGAAVASSLDQAAKALQQNPLAHDPLQRVLKMMQPLRGLAVLNEVPPMPDLLEGVERAIGEITRRTTETEGAALLFNAAAKAISRAAQEIAGTGRADADTAEAQEFARRLGAVVTVEDAVPIESLYHDDAGPHIVERGTPAARPGELGRLELVSHGEHLLRAADELERATSDTQRQLRAQALAATFRALASAGGGPLQAAVAAFAQAARDAVARGGAAAHTGQFAAQLREIGRLLSGTQPADEAHIGMRLTAIAGQLARLGGAPVPAAAQGPITRAKTDSAATAAPRRAPVATPPTTPPRRSGAPGTAPAKAGPSDEPPDIFGSWARYERLAASLGLGKASIADLLSGPPADPTAKPAAPAPRPAAAPARGKPSQAESAILISQLVYRGQAAATRAMNLRHDVRVALEDPAVNSALLRDLIEEIIDLVQLSLTDER